MQYRERTVEAIQWHPGLQIPGLVEVAAVDVREPFWRGTIACHGIVPLPLPHGGWLRVEDGDYVLRLPDGQRRVLPSSQFEQRYERMDIEPVRAAGVRIRTT
jgi:hypothetical protein